METAANTGYDLDRHLLRWKVLAVKDGLAAYQLVGEVTAHQGFDG